MAMNIDRHLTAHWDMFKHLVQGDGDSAEKHREFYDEYLAVMDLTAEFYLQTVETVFVEHLLPKGEMTHRGKPVDLTAIRRCAMAPYVNLARRHGLPTAMSNRIVDAGAASLECEQAFLVVGHSYGGYLGPGHRQPAAQPGRGAGRDLLPWWRSGT